MGASPLFTFIYFLKFVFEAKGAHALHSPFTFTLFKKVIKPAGNFRIEKIELLKKTLRRDHQLIDIIDFKTNSSHRKTISSIAKTSLSTSKFSAFLHLLINHLGAQVILETGTSLGINTLYLSASKAKKVITIEGSGILAKMAARRFEEFGKSIIVESGDVNEVFHSVVVKHEPDFVFLDADHRGATIIKQIDQLMGNSNKPSCIVIHDIYWSEDMNKAWKDLIKDSRFSLTVDIFQAGLIFPELDMEKQHFALRF